MLKLDAAKLEGSIGTLQKAFNTDVLEAVTVVADALKNTGDDNPQVAQVIEGAKKFQGQYNTQLESVEGFLEETAKVYDIAEFMGKRAHVGEVTSRDTGFQNTKINADSVMV